MGNNLCCPSHNARDTLSNPSPTEVLDSKLPAAKPLSKMTSKSSKSSRASQGIKSPRTNKTLYYSFENSMEVSQARSTLGMTDKERSASQSSPDNILSEVIDLSVNEKSATRYSEQNSKLDDEEEKGYNESLRQSKTRNKKTMKVVDEELEEHDESFETANGAGILSKNSFTQSRITDGDNDCSKMQLSLFSKDGEQAPNQGQNDILLNVRQIDWMKAAEDWVETIVKLTEKNQDGFDLIYEEKRSPHKLKVYLNSYKNQSGDKINRTQSEWIVPFSAEQYLRFMSNHQEQKALDKNLDLYEILETFGETEERWFTLYYLAYKKVLILSPRDFIYIKHVKKINENTWCDVSKSIIHEDYPESKEKVRGEIILSGSTVTEFKDQNTGKIFSKVRLYSENNFKMNIPTILAKSFASSEMKKFIEMCIERMNRIYVP